ncbi:Pyrin and HIN domain-containing protein 1 [Manis javanica]|nr:Pyrin and HIN domain-containing protein 1 [Manis javanica]
MGQSDQGVIERIVSNLLRNAIEYAPEGDDIQCRLERAASGWMLTIVNTAPNLQASDFGSIRTSLLAQGFEGGTAHHAGLGLALALALAHAIEPAAGVLTGQRSAARAAWPLATAALRLTQIYTAVPNMAPTPAVTAMANVPQTRRAAHFEERRTTHGGARSAEKGQEDNRRRDDPIEQARSGANRTTASGRPHPPRSSQRTPGRLQRASAQVSEMPNSSRPCAPRASCAINFVAT